MQTDLKFYFLCAKRNTNYHCAGSVTSNRIGGIFKYSRFAERITHCIIFSIRSQSPINYTTNVGTPLSDVVINIRQI